MFERLETYLNDLPEDLRPADSDADVTDWLETFLGCVFFSFSFVVPALTPCREQRLSATTGDRDPTVERVVHRLHAVPV